MSRPLATRARALAINPTRASPRHDTYWTQVQNGSDAFTEPTADPNGFRTDGHQGGQLPCGRLHKRSRRHVRRLVENQRRELAGHGYGVCTLTYGLVFDDNAAVWGNTPQEEAKARTVKDYWENVSPTPPRAAVQPADYAPLPASILAISRAGIDEDRLEQVGVQRQRQRWR